MGFIMHYCSKPKVFTPARVFFLALLLALSLVARADGIEVKSAELEAVDEALVLKAELEIGLSPAIEEALNKGVPLNFIAEFELKKPRWYWLDEVIVTAQQHIRLSYHALTRQFQLTSNGQYQNFSSLNDARRELGRLQGWPVVEKGWAKRRSVHVAGLRLRLDLAQLPKPLQVNALASKDWNLDSEWYRWSVNP